MKYLALIAATALAGTAAHADHHAQPEDVERQEMPSTEETQTYDGDNSYTATQPPPANDGSAVLGAALMSNFQVQTRADYPVCDRQTRDNCVQRRDPGY